MGKINEHRKTRQGEKNLRSRISLPTRRRIAGGFAGQRKYALDDVIGQPHASFFEFPEERRDPHYEPARLAFKEHLERTPYGETGGPSDPSRQPVIQKENTIIVL